MPTQNGATLTKRPHDIAILLAEENVGILPDTENGEKAIEKPYK